jgi:Sulfotransferase domain
MSRDHSNRRRRRLVRLLAFLPMSLRIRIERWLRGRDEVERLRDADTVIVSFGKSGRTWLRVMLSRYYQLIDGIPASALLDGTNYHELNSEIPTIAFSHDNYVSDYTGEHDSRRFFYQKKVVLLVRNPKDVAVSLFFQWQHRMLPSKIRLNGYPPRDSEITPFDFVMLPNRGLPRIIGFMNLWARESSKVEQILIVRYEDMRTDTAATLRRILSFADRRPVDVGAVDEAVAYASVENMRKLEETGVFTESGGRMRPGKVGDPDSYKVRRAKVGGYADYFSAEERARIDALVRETLSPEFGYEVGAGESDPTASA